MPPKAPLTREQQRLVQEALGLVQRVARRTARAYPRARVDDLVSVGQEALVDAARTFDPSRGVPFEGFAYTRVRGEMRDVAARESVPLAQRVRRALEVGADAFGADDDDADALSDTQEQANERARVWAQDVATSYVVAYLLATQPLDPEADLSGARERALASQALRAALAKLPEEDAALAREHYEAGVPLGVIAATRGVAERTVQRHHRRLLDTLRRALTNRGVTQTTSA
jgi:RNA polymerase sigma factor for flagellar operon FliA